MRRYYILEGDKTTVDGIVQKHTGAGSTFSWHGKTQSHIGDKIACPACKSVGEIKATGVRQPFDNHGHTPALNDDVCICKCSPPPKLVHSQTAFFQEVEDAIFNSTVSSYATNQILSNANKFTAQLKCIDKSTNEVLSNRKYYVEYANGEKIYGTTDSKGLTEVIKTDTAEEVSIHFYFVSPSGDVIADEDVNK